MATPFGSALGPIYPLGLISVTTAGTPVALTVNVVGTTAFGTPASPAPLSANQIIVMAPSTNTGDVQLVFKSQAATAGSGASVILNVPKGAAMKLESPQLSNPFAIAQLGLDATSSGDKAYITLVIV